MITIFILLVVYQIKHFLADFPLQNAYMLGKFKDGKAWILPLLAHVSVHGGLTFAIAYFVKPQLAISLALFDMAVHFIMDRIKASPNLLGRFESLSKMEFYLLFTGRGIVASQDASLQILPVPDDYVKEKVKNNRFFWWSLGLDQGVHHLTHYAIVWMLVR